MKAIIYLMLGILLIPFVTAVALPAPQDALDYVALLDDPAKLLERIGDDMTKLICDSCTSTDCGWFAALVCDTSALDDGPVKEFLETAQRYMTTEGVCSLMYPQTSVLVDESSTSDIYSPRFIAYIEAARSWDDDRGEYRYFFHFNFAPPGEYTGTLGLDFTINGVSGSTIHGVVMPPGDVSRSYTKVHHDSRIITQACMRFSTPHPSWMTRARLCVPVVEV